MPNSEPMRAMRDCVLFRGLPEAAVHRITARTNKAAGNVLPGRPAALAIPFVTPEIAPITSG